MIIMIDIAAAVTVPVDSEWRTSEARGRGGRLDPYIYRAILEYVVWVCRSG